MEDLDREIAKLKADQLKVQQLVDKYEKRERELEKKREAFEKFKQDETKEIEEMKADLQKRMKREQMVQSRNQKINESKMIERKEVEQMQSKLKKIEEESLAIRRKQQGVIDRQKSQIEELELKVQLLSENKDSKKQGSDSNFQQNPMTSDKDSAAGNVSTDPLKNDDTSFSQKEDVAEAGKEKKSPTQNSQKEHGKFDISKVKVKKVAAEKDQNNTPDMLAIKNIYNTFENTPPRDQALKNRIDPDSYSFSSNKFYKMYISTQKEFKKVVKHTVLTDGKVQNIYDNNIQEVIFPNGAKRETFPNGYSIVHFVNDDLKQILPDGTVIYFYKEHDTTQTSNTKDKTDVS